MSGIPTNIITVQFPDDGGGDPARGGSMGEVDTKAIVDVLKSIQTNVASIGNNVKLILETLRKISTMRPAEAAAPARAAAATVRAARSASERVRVEKVVRVDPSKAMVLRGGVEGFPDFQRVGGGPVMSEGFAELSRRRRAQGLARVSALPPGTPVVDVPHPLAYPGAPDISATGRRVVVPDPVTDLARVPGRAMTAPSSAVPGGMVPVMPAGAIPVPGAPGAPGAPGGPRPPIPPRPPVPPPGPGGFGAGMAALRGFLTPVGQILSIIRLVSGILSKIMEMVSKIVDYARKRRQELGTVDPAFATMEANLRIQTLMDRIQMARNPLVKASGTAMTQSELAMMSGTHVLRSHMAAGSMLFASQFYDSLGAIGFGYSGLARGSARDMMAGTAAFFQAGGILPGLASFGLGNMGALVQAIAAIAKAFGFDYNSYVKSRNLAQVRANTESLFVGDLQSMTAGRFSLQEPYPGKRSANNWWSWNKGMP